MEQDSFEVDLDNGDDWFQSLEDELNEINFPDPNSELALETQTDLTPDNFFDDSLESEVDLFTDNQEFASFDDIEFISSENHADLSETKA
jgi:hypothetical protein